MSITKLDQMFEVVRSKPKKRLVAAYANDSHTISAVSEAVDLGIVEGILVGDEETIKKVCKEEKIDVKKFKIVQEANEGRAAAKAVELINKGEAEVLMKGLVSSDKYMKAILDKEKGLTDPGAVLSHVIAVESPNYHKLLFCSDVAVIPAPELKEKIAMANYLIKTAKSFNIDKPKVALITATEQVLYKIPACAEAAIISKMGERGQIKGAVIDGPLALDVAVDKEAAEIKGLKSEVAGDADCLLFPNIEAANVFYKASTKLGNAELGAMVVGARCPAILTSRGDSTKTKLYSITMAALCA
jgi:phosphate butyryltransferase